MQLVQLLAWLFVAQLTGAFVLAFVRDLVEGLVQVDDLRSHLDWESLDSHDAQDYEDSRGEKRHDHHLIEDVLDQDVIQVDNALVRLRSFYEKGKL